MRLEFRFFSIFCLFIYLFIYLFIIYLFDCFSSLFNWVFGFCFLLRMLYLLTPGSYWARISLRDWMGHGSQFLRGKLLSSMGARLSDTRLFKTSQEASSNDRQPFSQVNLQSCF